jgi:hypothetical protein
VTARSPADVAVSKLASVAQRHMNADTPGALRTLRMHGNDEWYWYEQGSVVTPLAPPHRRGEDSRYRIWFNQMWRRLKYETSTP